MHNLHFLLINADTAQDAISEAKDRLMTWGDAKNWSRIGGVASEDGSDDIENHEDAGWGLSYLDDEQVIPQEGTYFRRAVALLRRSLTGPMVLPYGPYTKHPDLRSALDHLGDRLKAFDPEQGSRFDLLNISGNIEHLFAILSGRQKSGGDVPHLNGWQLDRFGLTNLTCNSDGAKRFLVFLDMHS